MFYKFPPISRISDSRKFFSESSKHSGVFVNKFPNSRTPVIPSCLVADPPCSSPTTGWVAHPS